MFKSEIKKPLLQSAAVIALGLICFGFVVSSGSHTFFGALWAIILGILYTILYAIGLTIGVVFCIACLFAIFLGTIYLVSKEQARSLWDSLKIKLRQHGEEIKDFADKCGCSCNISSSKVKSNITPVAPSSPKQDDILDKMNKLEAEIEELKEKEKRNTEIIAKLSTDK